MTDEKEQDENEAAGRCTTEGGAKKLGEDAGALANSPNELLEKISKAIFKRVLPLVASTLTHEGPAELAPITESFPLMFQDGETPVDVGGITILPDPVTAAQEGQESD